MILTEEQREDFFEIVKPVMKWLNDNCHPHVEITIDPIHAELKEGIASTGRIFDYVKD